MSQNTVSSSLQLFNNKYFTPERLVRVGFVVAIAGSAIALLANHSLFGPVGSPGCIAGLVLGGGLTLFGLGVVARVAYAYSQLKAEMKRIKSAAVERGIEMLKENSQNPKQVLSDSYTRFLDTLETEGKWTEGAICGYESTLQFTYMLIRKNLRQQVPVATVNELTEKFLVTYRFGSEGEIRKNIYLKGSAFEQHKKRFQTVGDPLWRCHVLYQALADEINRLSARVPALNPMEVET